MNPNALHSLYKEQKATIVVQFLGEVTAFFPNIPGKIFTDNGFPFTYHQGDYTQHLLKKYFEVWVSNIASRVSTISGATDR